MRRSWVRWCLLVALLAVGSPLLRDASAAQVQVPCGGPALQSAVTSAGQTSEDDVLVLSAGCAGDYVLTDTLRVPSSGGALTVRAARRTTVRPDQPRQIFVATAPLTLERLMLTGGRAPGSSSAGAVVATAALVLDDVVIDGISAAGPGYEGSAVSAGGPLQVLNSSITRSGDGGSALLTTGPSSAIVNSTVSDNDTDYAVFLQGGGSHRLVNSTVVAKRGYALLSNAGTTLVNTVLDREGAALGTCTSQNGTRPGDGSGNVEDGRDCGLQSGSRAGTDPQLLPLGDYGGLTLTRPPAPGSAAHGAGNGDVCRTSVSAGGAARRDQRGFQRPPVGPCDAGAVERGPVLEVPTSLAFGDVAVGASRSMPVLVRNVGDLPAQLGTTSTSGGGFGTGPDTCSGARLAPTGTCRTTVTFTPLTPGTASGTLAVPSDEQPTARSVLLTGNGTAAAGAPTTAPPSIDPTTAPPTTDPTTAPPTTDPTTAPPTTDPTTAPPTTDPTTAPPTTDPTTAPPTTAPPTTDPTTAPPTRDPTAAPPTTDPTTAPPATDGAPRPRRRPPAHPRRDRRARRPRAASRHRPARCRPAPRATRPCRPRPPPPHRRRALRPSSRPQPASGPRPRPPSARRPPCPPARRSRSSCRPPRTAGRAAPARRHRRRPGSTRRRSPTARTSGAGRPSRRD